MISPQMAFAPDYARARVMFLEAAAIAGMSLKSYNHPLPGKDGEVLAMDVAIDGPADAERMLIVSSACHGAEGFCGSGVQVFAICDDAWRNHAREAGVTVMYVHALNPHGFSHLRRVTHENVDLNRNFQDFAGALPVNEPYAALHALLLPERWPPTKDNQAALNALVAERGEAYYQAAVTQGQHAFADGMFFGGTEPSWSNTTFRQVLQDHAQTARHIAWIDVHTGLGPSGLGERISATRDDPAALKRARQWWGGDGRTPVTSIYDGSSSSAMLTGLMWGAIYQECPQAEYTGIAMEYGTLPVMSILQALRADHWLHLHPEAPEEQRELIQQGMRDAFYVDDHEWRAQIISQARQSLFQAATGLEASGTPAD